MSISRFTEYGSISATRERGKDKNPMQRVSGEVTSIGQGTKHIDREVIVRKSSSSSSNSVVQGFTPPAIFQIFSRE